MTKVNHPTVGLLIPTFNRRVFLENALNSARGQTYHNIDIIVIDNGSTDGTAEFMAGVYDPRVRYIVNESNIGMIGSINKAVALFSDDVEWCTILSDDDLLDKEFIMNLIHTASDTAAKSIIHSHRIFITKGGNRIREAAFPPKEETALDYIKMRSQFKRETYLTGVMFNRKAFREIKGYPNFSTGLGSDDAFIFALALKDRLVFEQSAIAYIRIHEDAESRDFSDSTTKMRTFQQFGEYCKRVEQESNTLDQTKLRELDNILKKYLRALYSFWWIQSAHYSLTQGDNTHEQLRELLSFAKDNLDKFTFRVKFAVAFEKLTGSLPEAFAVYRICWRNIVKIAQLLKR